MIRMVAASHLFLISPQLHLTATQALDSPAALVQAVGPQALFATLPLQFRHPSL